jgi:hypothetical protein
MSTTFPNHLDDALYALTLIFQETPIPDRPDRKPLIRRDVLIEQLTAKGISVVNANQLIDNLVREGVFEALDFKGKEGEILEAEFTTTVALDGTDRGMEIRPIRKLAINRAAWQRFRAEVHGKGAAPELERTPAQDGHPASKGRSVSPSDKQFLALDRLARLVAKDEMADAMSRDPVHPLVVKNRRDQHRVRCETVLQTINQVARELDIPYSEWEPRLRRLCQAMMGVMNYGSGGGFEPWFGWDHGKKLEGGQLLMQRLEECREASADLERLAEWWGLTDAAVQHEIGSAPVTWDELMEQLRAWLEDLRAKSGPGRRAVQPAPTAETPPVQAAGATASVATPAPRSSPLAPKELAALLGPSVSPAAVDSFLRRYREKYPDCFITVDDDDRRRNQPKYLYYPDEVMPALKAHFGH